jgi:fibronectin type 3 domain-containing protein/regulation of enolase protein 1 (concanavalin A-like superfamily)
MPEVKRTTPRNAALATACARRSGTAFEHLEHRQLLAAASTLPLRLDFNGGIGSSVLDKQDRGTGFTGIQANADGDEYQKALIDLDSSAGVLKLTTRGTSLKGSATGADNSLANGLEITFNGYQSGFLIETRLIGPLSNLKDRFEQAGIYFGADQDNFVKLVAGKTLDGQVLSFEDEFTNSTGGVTNTRNGSNAATGIGNFASINTLDLRIVGDAATGKVSAYYRANSDSGSFTKVAYDITIAAEKRSTFFNNASKAGIIAIGKTDLGPVTATFDSFGVTAGTAILSRPSVTRLEGMSGTTLDVRRDAAIKAILSLTNDASAVDIATLSNANVKVYRAYDSADVSTSFSLVDGGTALVLTPATLLDPNTTYTVEITTGLKDQAGATFQPFIGSFTTGALSSGELNSAGPQATFSVDKLYFSDISGTASGGSGTSLVQKIRITNTGVADLVLGANALSFGGSNAGDFMLSGTVTLPATISPGEFIDIPVVLKATAIGIRTGTLTVTSNDPTLPAKTITLRGLGTAGNGGDLEPSLQRILDLYQIPVNVGDPTPDTTDIPSPPTSLDELAIQTLRKSGADPVTIEVLANFANSQNPSSRFGYYSPGTVGDRTQLFTVGLTSSQTVRPVTSGALSFNPSGDFGIYGEFPAFAGRVVTSEKYLNTWETNTARQQKVRFYPLKNADGSVVPNAYIFTFEEYGVSFDQNDIVGIIRNVVPVGSGPELGFANQDGVPFADRLVFSRIRDHQVPNATTGYIDNTVHDISTLRVTNTGDQPLIVTDTLISSASDFTITSGGGPFTLAPGASRDIVVKFIYDKSGTGHEQRNATLTLKTNDTDEPTRIIKLAGMWQSNSEADPNGIPVEATAAQIIQSFGYAVNIGTFPAMAAVARAGEEILSTMWQSVENGVKVGARLLSAFHQNRSTTNSRLRYLLEGASGVGTTFVFHQASDGQTFLPHLNGSTTQPAYGDFQPNTSKFSWTVDSAQSIDSRNTTAYAPGTFPASDGGHALRFYAAKDQAGNIIPNTYILLQDYVGQSYSNYDYQDNIYILYNVKPVSGPLAPANPTANATGLGNVLNWTKNPEGNLAGYNIYRSTSSGGTYDKLNTALVTGNSYTDSGALVGTQYFYKIVPVDYHGTEGTAATASKTRTSDTAAPMTPAYPTAQGQTTGIYLNWLDNTEADLAGYNVYRASAFDGTYVKLNGSLLTSSAYVDLSAPGAATSYYRVTAVDGNGNESVAATMNSYRPADGNVPASPSSLIATGQTGTSITLSWTDNANNETGFILEKQNADGTFSQAGTTNANAASLTVNGLQGGTTYVFRVRATNAAGPSGFSNNLSASTTQSAPVAASNLATTALTANAVRLTWNDNATNEVGYRIERRLGTSGTWQVIDTVGTNVTLYVDQSAAASTTYNYQVFATNSAGASPASNTASISTPAADPYQSADIGTPTIGGSTNTLNPGKDYDIVAGGTDVWSTSDQFRFVYKSITGDFDYSARIDSITVGDSGSMAGLMARGSLAANAQNIFMRASANGSLRSGYRAATGGSTVGVGTMPVTFPNAYVRLQRVGNVFTTYGSTDGTTWTVFTQQTIAMGSSVFLGIAVSARSATATTTARVRGLTDRLAATAPNAASDLLGSADPSTPSVSLAWTDNSTNESGFRVERRLSGSSIWSTVATLGANVTSYLDNDVTIDTQYVYRVFATNAAGDALPTSELTITVAAGVPASPNGLAVSNVAGGIKLVWNDASSNELNFQVERKLADGDWTSVAILNANVTTYTDASISAGTTYSYRVRALGSTADSGYSNEATIAAPAALSFTSIDIGGATGGATQTVTEGSDYNVTASGTDIWNTSDQFRFVYRQVTGNFDIRVRVAGINFTSDQSMAGLMARATLDANSRNVFVKARADGSDRMTYRTNTGGTTTGVGSGTSTFPNGWLRLTRVGNVFTGYSSIDGATWTVVSSVTLSLPTTMYIGMAVASHVTGVTTTAQFKDLTLA